jgi:hypothetical protein
MAVDRVVVRDEMEEDIVAWVAVVVETACFGRVSIRGVVFGRRVGDDDGRGGRCGSCGFTVVGVARIGMCS